MFLLSSRNNVRMRATSKSMPGLTRRVLDADGDPLEPDEGRLAVKGPTRYRYLATPRQADYVPMAGI